MIKSVLELERYSYAFDKNIKRKIELREDEDERGYELYIDDALVLPLSRDDVKELIKYLQLVIDNE